ncbi:hypothetical protein BJX61DRAFT_533765 [Aspergillus egyptiacus]|nr:hypothetical protein BJX61DRAFT_533765 [Aspergillus egyptiacus]
MASLLRSGRAIRPFTTTVCSSVPQHSGRRLYGQSSYGGNGETHPEEGRNKPTRDMEHPGAPPPNVSKDPGSGSQTSSSQSGEGAEQTASQTPSNKAKPTIKDNRSDNIDKEGHIKADIPEDVRRHNEEVDQRHDKPYNRINDDGKVGKPFWSKLDGSGGY